jgi:hypothetical protein
MSDTKPQDIIGQILATMAEGNPTPQSLIESIRRLDQQHGALHAADAVRMILVVHPASRDALSVGADLLFGQEDWIEAGQLARWVTTIGPSTTETEMTAAAYLFRARHLELARRHGQAAERLSPESAGPKFMHGRILAALGQVAEGLAKIDQAAEIDAEFRFAAKILHLGLTTEDFERVKKAVAVD